MEQIKYSTAFTMSVKWNIPENEVVKLCEEGKIEEATFNDGMKKWLIPSNTKHPYTGEGPTPPVEGNSATTKKQQKNEGNSLKHQMKKITNSNRLDGVAIAMTIMLIAIFLFWIGSLGTIDEDALPSIYQTMSGYEIGSFEAPANAGLILVFVFTIVSLIVTLAVVTMKALKLSKGQNVVNAINAVALMFCFLGFVFSIQGNLTGSVTIGFCPVMVIILYFVLAVLAVYKVSSKK